MLYVGLTLVFVKSHSYIYIYIYILISANDSLNYGNLTNDNIFNDIKKFDASMGTNKKLLMYHLQIKKKANFCKQNGLPPVRQKEKERDFLASHVSPLKITA